MKRYQEILLAAAQAQIEILDALPSLAEPRLTAAAKGAAQELGARRPNGEQAAELAKAIARRALHLALCGAAPTTGDFYEAGAASVREVMAHGR